MTVVFDQYQYNVSVHPFATSSEKKKYIEEYGEQTMEGQIVAATLYHASYKQN